MNKKEIEEWKLAYLAGIIDGEGTIRIAKQIKERGKTHQYSLRMQVANTDKGLMDWLKENFGGSVHISRDKRSSHYKELYQWEISSNDTYKLLKEITDYLVIKRKQAELGIEFYKKNMGWKVVSNGRVPMWISSKREEYFQRLKELHL